MSADPINSAPPDTDEPYVPRETLKQRVDYQPEDFYHDSHNQYKRFDELLDRLAGEATAIVNNYTGDQTWHRETDRQDVIQAPNGRIINLVYPVVNVSKVEWLRLQSDGTKEWRELSAGRWYETKHGVKLRSTQPTNRYNQRNQRLTNPLLAHANAREWGDIARELRVTYTRGFESIPKNIQEITITIVNRMLRNLKNEQNVAAASPDELAGVSPQFDTVLSDEVEAELNNLTTLGRGTYTV